MAKLPIMLIAAAAAFAAFSGDSETNLTATAEMSGSAPGSVITVEIPEPRKFSVKKVAAKIRELGFTSQVREALIAADAYEMYVGANYLKEDDEDFIAMKTAIQEITGISGDRLEEILADCIWEE